MMTNPVHKVPGGIVVGLEAEAPAIAKAEEPKAEAAPKKRGKKAAEAK